MIKFEKMKSHLNVYWTLSTYQRAINLSIPSVINFLNYRYRNTIGGLLQICYSFAKDAQSCGKKVRLAIPSPYVSFCLVDVHVYVTYSILTVVKLVLTS